MFKTCCCRGLKTRPPTRKINCSLSHKISIRFQNLWFIFHVSFLYFNLLNINHLEKWNIRLQCFILSFMFHSKKHWGRKTKTLWERFKNTVGAIQKHWGSVKALPQCFEKWNMKLKMKHKSRMFQPSKVLIINKLKHKNETWKQKTS